jgi:hypothetical protein
MNIRLGSRTLVVGAATTIVLGAIAIAALTAGGIAAWEYSNSDAFCANVCHAVHPEETVAHNASAHARVQCVECHMGRLSTLHLMALKPTHAKELWGMIAGYERPVHSSTLRPARQNCEGCHWPQAVHRDSVTVHKRYGTDPKSTETDIRLTLHTTADMERTQPWKATGIHWHIANEVEFIATDPQSRNIPWVQVRRPDGTKVTYIDKESKLTAADLAKFTPRRIECYDCHNSVGHPFPNPAELVDEAIATGTIDRTLPNTKARALSLIEATANLSGTLEERTAVIRKAIAENRKAANVPAELNAAADKFDKAMQDVLLRSTFSAKDITWKSFPNHVGHRDTPGCFRCHDGKHFNAKGESIRLQCTLCHDLPAVKIEGGKSTVASTVMPGLTPPDSHNEPNFMHDHRFRVDKSCSGCHGELKFGTDGGNFCANPACHGRKWPGVNLNVAPT